MAIFISVVYGGHDHSVLLSSLVLVVVVVAIMASSTVGRPGLLPVTFASAGSVRLRRLHLSRVRQSLTARFARPALRCHHGPHHGDSQHLHRLRVGLVSDGFAPPQLVGPRSHAYFAVVYGEGRVPGAD